MKHKKIKKIYDVSWVGPDGPDGYYVELTSDEAIKIEDILKNRETHGMIEGIRVKPIVKPWVMTKEQFLKEIHDRWDI